MCICCRLFEVYGIVNTHVKDRSNDGSGEVVDEHRQHSDILEQLQHLKSAATVRLVLGARANVGTRVWRRQNMLSATYLFVQLSQDSRVSVAVLLNTTILYGSKLASSYDSDGYGMSTVLP